MTSNEQHMDLEQKAEKLIKKHKMIESGDNILVAFSGGSDSAAMLFFLIKYVKYMNKNQKIYAAHMNHMIRGEDACRDEEFAIETCGKYNIKIFTERKNIPEIAKKSKKTIEEAARDARYDFLRRTAREIGGDIKDIKYIKNVKIAVAHTASDNTETVIFNMARGCGIDGMCGISPVNGNIIRPLLLCNKQDILKYCEKNNIFFVEDKTNRDEKYTRNFIRHNIAGKLKEKFVGADENIFKMTNIMRDTADFIDLCAVNVIKYNADNSGGIDISRLLSLHKALRYAVIMKMYETAVSSDISDISNIIDIKDFKKLEYKHVLYIDEIIQGQKDQENKSIDLSGFIKAVFLNGKFYINRVDINKKKPVNAGYIKNILQGINIINADITEIIIFFGFLNSINSINSVDSFESFRDCQAVGNIKFIKINGQSSENIYNLFNYAVIDFDKIKGRIFARSRKPGDEYVFYGQTKSVKKNYINYKVPAAIRDILPVFCDDYGIFWACGLPVADRVKIFDETRNAVSIKVTFTLK